jgi:hypothetical protein
VEIAAPSSRARVATSVAVIVALAALLGGVGADARWLAALGHEIVGRGSIPSGLPFASVPTSSWANPLALAELIFYWLEHAFGDRGLMLAQLLAVAGALLVLARDANAGGTQSARTSGALLLAGLGALPSFAIARVQLFSLLLFPVLIALLRADARRPSPRIWLAVPLLALWANLHGAVLLGFAVLIGYLLLVRAKSQPWQTGGLAAAALLALGATPALLRTADYYHGLLTNQAAQQGQGMWGPLSLTSPLDLLLLACAVVLARWFWRGRPRLWEAVIALARGAITIGASRNGVFLLMFLAPVAARAPIAARARSWGTLLPVGAAAAAVAAVAFALVRGPVSEGASPSLVARAVTLANGSPVLASDVIAEQIALAGGRVWVSDPIDAFPSSDQTRYLDWLDGSSSGLSALQAPVRLVLVQRGTGAARLTARTSGFRLISEDRRSALYERLT